MRYERYVPPGFTVICQTITGPDGPFASSSTWDGTSEAGGVVPMGTGSDAQISMSSLMRTMTLPPQNEYSFSGYCHATCAVILVSSILKIAARVNGGGGGGLVAAQPPGIA